MKKILNKKNSFFFIFTAIISIAIFFRFFNLNWGAPYFFHPDERNIASSISKIKFPDQMNPEFFAYGSLPIYSTYFMGVGQNIVSNFFTPIPDLLSVNFEQSIILLRITSSVFSTIIIFLIFNLLYKAIGLKYAFLGASLAGFNVGLIQYSHFGTFEIWLSFLLLIFLNFLYKYLNYKKNIYLLLSGIILGLLISVKISSIIAIPIIFIAIFWNRFTSKKTFGVMKNYAISLLFGVSILLVSLLIVILTSPYFFIDFRSFIGSINYESGVALGTIKVFYTSGFTDTIPIIYQLFHVYPFILNPINLILILLLLPFIVINIFRTGNKLLILSIFMVLLIFLSQSFFYVKWIRYYIPTIPFLIIILTYGIKILTEKIKVSNQKIFFYVTSTILLFTAFIFSFSYFKVVLYDNDTRLAAASFAEKNIPRDAKIITEVYDMGIIPFNKNFSNITLFNFYELDDEFNKEIRIEELNELIKMSDYLILPSQRLMRNRILYKNHFPEGYKFYSNLENGYDLIYQTPCDIFCKIVYLRNPIYFQEETSNVFDRPSIMIFKINK